MTITELRIGNLVYTDRMIDNELVVVNTISYNPDKKDYLLSISHFPYLTISQCKPIPLTEEWLVKWRFDKDKSTRNLLFDYIIYFERQGNQLFLCNNQTKVQYLIEWVHEAQNIYFALTGEELVCK